MSGDALRIPAVAAESAEAKGLGWMATCALVYALSAMVASVVNVVNVATLASNAGVGALLAALSLTYLLGAVGWIMALPALVVLALGFYELGRDPAAVRADLVRLWMLYGVGTALFVVTVPLVVLEGLARTVNPALVLLASGIGLASALVLLLAAALPAVRRAPASWAAPARLAVLLGLVAVVLEGMAAAASLATPSLPLLPNWPPLAWGFPASFAVLASASILFWTYSSMQKAAKAAGAPVTQVPLTGVP